MQLSDEEKRTARLNVETIKSMATESRTLDTPWTSPHRTWTIEDHHERIAHFVVNGMPRGTIELDGRFGQIIDGYHRFAAAIVLGLSTIRIDIGEPHDADLEKSLQDYI